MSDFVGKDLIVWRYDPILITEKYSLDFHIRAFAQMCGRLQGKTNEVIISFLDLYRKTRNNFPEGRTVSWQERAIIGEAFSRIAAEHGMRLAACNEGTDMEAYHADCSGCMTREKIEKAFDQYESVIAVNSLDDTYKEFLAMKEQYKASKNIDSKRFITALRKEMKVSNKSNSKK